MTMICDMALDSVFIVSRTSTVSEKQTFEQKCLIKAGIWRTTGNRSKAKNLKDLKSHLSCYFPFLFYLISAFKKGESIFVMDNMSVMNIISAPKKIAGRRYGK